MDKATRDINQEIFESAKTKLLIVANKATIHDFNVSKNWIVAINKLLRARSTFDLMDLRMGLFTLLDLPIRNEYRIELNKVMIFMNE